VSKCLVSLELLLALTVVAAQSPQLRIVVLEGEGAVNIIQQKTAVRALVEVRDSNNLPVSGATVTFGVTGQGGATVAGAQSVTVMTNTAGRAALSGMTPASSGGLQLSVTASYNGLTAATTIAQSVVATAAVAAAAGGGAVAGTAAGAAAGATGSAAGGAAATGGGLGTGAIVGVAGGVAAVAGGVAVAGAAGGDGENGSNNAGTPPVPALPTCEFSHSPRELLVPVAGGSFPISISMTPSICAQPTWSIDTNLSSHFVTATPVSGSGSATVTLTVAPFSPTAAFPSRSGAIGFPNGLVQIFQPTRF